MEKVAGYFCSRHPVNLTGHFGGKCLLMVAGSLNLEFVGVGRSRAFMSLSQVNLELGGGEHNFGPQHCWVWVWLVVWLLAGCFSTGPQSPAGLVQGCITLLGSFCCRRSDT